MQAKASKSDIMALSIFYLINCYKNIQNIKNCLLIPVAGEECGVIHQPQMLEPFTRCHFCT